MSDIQVEQSVPVIPSGPKRFGRRDFLQALGVTTVGGALAGTGIAAAVRHNETQPEQPIPIAESPQELNTLTPENKLEKAGLAEFIPIYLQSKLFFEKWGVYPPVFSDIQILLFKITRDDPDSQKSDLYKNLLSEWGDKIQDDENIVSDNNIEFSPDVDEASRKQIENNYKKTLQSFRPLAKVRTPHMKYGDDVSLTCGEDAEGNPALGCTDRESYTHLGNQTDVNFVSTLLHESNHNFLDKFGKNPEVLRYVTKRHLSDYSTGTISLIDQFLTDVAEDSSTNPAEYTYGFANWKDRSKTRNKLTEYQSILGLQEEQVTQPTTINYTNLPEDPQYNRVLRAALKMRLNTSPDDRAQDKNTHSLDEMIESEMKFLFHILHNIQLEKPEQVGRNSNAIIQRFLDMKITHQRLWLPLASGGSISGTISIDSLRSKCGLPALQNEDTPKEKPQEPWDFDYEEFGGAELLETGSEFINLKIFSLPECSTDHNNKYVALDISPRMKPKEMPNTLLLAMPKSISISNCEINNNTAQITLSDNSIILIPIGVISDASSGNYGSISMQDKNITSDHAEIEYMGVKKSKLTNQSIIKVTSQIGTIGSLNNKNRSRIHNVPGISISNTTGMVNAYTAQPDIAPLNRDIIQFQGRSDSACIIKTEQGPQLFINALPVQTEYDKVPDLIDDMSNYGAIIVGEKLLLDFAQDPDSLRIDYQIHSSIKDNPGVVSATIIAEKNGVVRIFPLFIRE